MNKPIADPAPSVGKQPNYTPEQEALLKEKYEANPTSDTVDELAKELGKPRRSIIAKLSHMHIYVTPPRVTKNGAPIVKKDALVAQIEKHLEEEFPSLSKTNKRDLEKMVKRLNDFFGEPEADTLAK